MPFYPKRGSGFAHTESDEETMNHQAKRLFEEHGDPRTVRQELAKDHGNAASKDAMRDFDKKSLTAKRSASKVNNRYLAIKDILDKVAFTFANLQFLNILFFILYPSFMVVGLVLAMRSLITAWIENNYERFTAQFTAEKTKGYWFGALLGFTLILLSITITFAMTFLYAVLFVVAGVLSALYVKSGLQVLRSALPRDKMNHFVKWIAYYGLIITAIVLIIAGAILDVFQDEIIIPIWGMELHVYGYVLLFFMAGLIFIISAYVLSLFKQARMHEEVSHRPSVRAVFADTIAQVRSLSGYTRLVVFAGALFYSTQISLNYFLGLSLFDEFMSFTFVAILLASTIVTSFIVPLFFDKSHIKKNGVSSLLLLGTGLAFLLPVLFAITHFPPALAALDTFFRGAMLTESISAAQFFPLFYIFIGIAGASIAGVAFSRFSLESVHGEEKVAFMGSLGFLTGIFTALIIATVFTLRDVVGSAWASYVVLGAIYLIVAILFARIIARRVSAHEKYFGAKQDLNNEDGSV